MPKLKSPSWSCPEAVSKPVWHTVAACTMKTPDDGQRNCPKHAEFPPKNKFEKLVHLVGFNIRNLSRCTVTWTSNLALLLYRYSARRQHPPGRWLVAVLALMAACILIEEQLTVITATSCSSVSADIFEPCATSRPDFEECAKRNLQTAVANFSAGMSNDRSWHVGITGDKQTFLTAMWLHRFVRRFTVQKRGHSSFKDPRINPLNLELNPICYFWHY